MSRLTEKNAIAVCGHCDSWDICKPDDTCFVKEAYKKLAHYEDLEEQGLLLELPCEVGEVVYVVNDEVEVWRVSGFSIYEEDSEVELTRTKIDVKRMCCWEEDVAKPLAGFGVNIFLTEEAAATKLAELKGEQIAI